NIFAGMNLNTVIFDMDGLLIDSEPLWGQAAEELFSAYDIHLTPQQYGKTTGLRTREFLKFWFHHFHISPANLPDAESQIVHRVVELVTQHGKPMPGVRYIFDFFKERNFNIGLATSSGHLLIEVVVDILGIRKDLQAVSSANDLGYGKPHPEVYLNCAGKLSVHPRQCLCFEDSFNGMIAVKAAHMKCVVIPEKTARSRTHWDAADLKLDSLAAFDDSMLEKIGR
ncbi:MAG TPA: hexitol phosphatase HxpB, partial [Ferruginibacter sp.]|nr:hexitol phosphatase HxpB [Ferruginibacter sp.]